MAREIERKFIITGKPEGFKELNHGEAWTYYLSVEPEHRVRHIKDTYREYFDEAHKYGSGLDREEIENNISEDDFNRVARSLGLPVIHSEFWHLDWNGVKLEVMHKDVDTENDFWVLEVEFESAQEALAFVLPESIHGMDVTFVEDYKMRNYWRRTRLGGKQT